MSLKECDENNSDTELSHGPHSIEFKNVWFKYNNASEYALKNINILFKPYENISIVGLNGAGKTKFITACGMLKLKSLMGEVAMKNKCGKTFSIMAYCIKTMFLMDKRYLFLLMASMIIASVIPLINANLISKVINLATVADNANRAVWAAGIMLGILTILQSLDRNITGMRKKDMDHKEKLIIFFQQCLIMLQVKRLEFFLPRNL